MRTYRLQPIVIQLPSGYVIYQNQSYTWTITVTPTTTGTFSVDWNMLQESVVWFGSDPVESVSVVDRTAPSVPTGLACTSKTDTTVTLSWNPSTDAGSGVAGYNIYRNGTFDKSTTSNTFNDTGLTYGTTYNYTVAAYDKSNNTSAQCPANSVKASGNSFTTAYDLTTAHSATSTINSATDSDYYSINKSAGDFLEAYIVDPAVSGKSLQYTVSIYDPNHNEPFSI